MLYFSNVRRALLPGSIALLASLAVPCGTASAQISFTDVSAAAKGNRAGESYGASWGDLNGDGFPDLFASNPRQQPSLYLNRGDGTFYETAPQVLTWRNRPRADTHGGSWADFDNDGDQDLLVSSGTGNLSQLLVNEYGRMVDRTVERGLTTTNLGGRLPVWFDYDGDRLSDFVMTQYGGVAKLFRQDATGFFTETTSNAKLLCKRFHYGQLLDFNGDGRLDLMCSDEALFPQKIYDTLPFPWKKLFDNTIPNVNLPPVDSVADSILGDFNNDGRMDLFVLGGVQLRPASVVQGSPTHLESQLTGGTKGFKFVTSGRITFNFDWNKQSETAGTDLKKIQVGAAGVHPTTNPFTLDPADPNVLGMPPAPQVQSDLPVMQIGYDGATQQWTVVIQTRLSPTSPNVFSEAYVQVDSEQPMTGLVSTGLWPTDKTGRPTLLTNYSGGFVDETVRAGLDTPVQCVSVTTGDYDNDMDLDLYLACRTGASNIANILYQNQGDGTFVPVANAGGAAGQVGIAVASGAGTADTAVTADYDVDGYLDLYVTNGFNLRPLQTGGSNRLYRNTGTGNHWIQLDLVGTRSDRDAVGARVYATANGVTQLRIQNGAYHRWAQDARRSHFGLAGATAVDLRIEWPSGAVQSFTNVAADKLYRITEGAAPVPIAVGASLAYQCGPPAINTAVDKGIFLWRDCPSGEWRLKTAAAGSSTSVIFAGSFTSSAPFVSVKPVGLTTADMLDVSVPSQITFRLDTRYKASDGINFTPADKSRTCMKLDLPAGMPVFYGPFRVPVTPPFDLDRQVACN